MVIPHNTCIPFQTSQSCGIDFCSSASSYWCGSMSTQCPWAYDDSQMLMIFSPLFFNDFPHRPRGHQTTATTKTKSSLSLSFSTLLFILSTTMMRSSLVLVFFLSLCSLALAELTGEIVSCSGWALNRYPELKEFLKGKFPTVVNSHCFVGRIMISQQQQQ